MCCQLCECADLVDDCQLTIVCRSIQSELRDMSFTEDGFHIFFSEFSTYGSTVKA